MTLREWCARLEQVRGAGIQIVGRVPAHAGDNVEATFAEAAGINGYVVVHAHRAMQDEARRKLWHRHVALIHRGEPTADSVRWIRELAMASPRAHVVLVMAPEPDRVHEGDLWESAERTPHEERASRFWNRGRRAAARRWAGAAMAHGHRVRNEWSAARAFAQLVRYTGSTHASALEPVVQRGCRLLAELDALAPRSYVVAALADAWMTRGEMEVATAALAGVDVECVVSSAHVPSWIRSAQCELACWQGNWDAAARWASGPELLGWRAVVAFARRDMSTVCGLAEALSDVTPEHVTWRAVLPVLAQGAAGDVAGLTRAVAHASRIDHPARWWDTLVLESLRLAGADEAAQAWIHTVQTRPRGPAEQLLWEWVTRDPEQGETPDLNARIQRAGIHGIRRWGMRRQDMHMWAGVSSLLQTIHEAEEPASALRQACQWARVYTGADAVGIMATDHTVCACDPEHVLLATNPPGVQQEVRYGGVRIGDVVMTGMTRDAAEARAVATALAVACAPALRARLDDWQLSRAGESLAGELLGVSPAMRGLRDAVARAAGSSFPVLIEGESGTGKELVARALHRLSPRRDRRWAAVNCAALTDELLEAELFGHTRGAFTGAVGPRVGLLEDAHEGTLFLDEVAELSPRGQAKLLRVLQEGEIRRVGENVSRRVDVRVVAATNRPLAEAARQGTYREDLVFRLAVIRLQVPPLRDRIEDIPLLAHAFWKSVTARVPTQACLAPDAIAALCRAPWSGNVRELQNVMAALAVGGPSRGRITGRLVEAVLAQRSTTGVTPVPMSLANARLLCDRRMVAASLARHGHQRSAAARELGVSRQGLTKLMERLELDAVASKGAFR